MKRFIYIAIGILIILLAGGASKAPSPPKPTAPVKELQIIYSGNTLGELKPCGCDKEEDQGGIERRMAYLRQVYSKTKNTLLVDTGDNFKESTRQGKLKAQFLMSSLVKMRYDAVALGEKDLIYGNQFLKELGPVPWVASNLVLSDLDLARYRIKTYNNGLKVAVLALDDPGLFYVSHHSNFELKEAASTLTELLADLKLKEAPDLVVLLSHMRRVDGIKMLDIEGVDIVINGHIENETDKIDMEPVIKGDKVFVQPGPLGQKIGEIHIRWNASGERSLKHKIIRLDSKIPNDPEMTRLYAEYNAKVEELFLASLQAKRQKQSTPLYATAKACETCHPGPYKTWLGSRHSRAYESLKRVHKSFDPECLGCHTTGFNKVGGFLSEIDTPELMNVQCEMCHGPRLEHAQSPGGGFAQKAADACKQCHVPLHSPKFDYEKYWPKIQH